jgi:hypothetical protein
MPDLHSPGKNLRNSPRLGRSVGSQTPKRKEWKTRLLDRLGLWQTDDLLAWLEEAALLEHFHALETLQNVALGHDGPGAFETAMLRHKKKVALWKRGANYSCLSCRSNPFLYSRSTSPLQPRLDPGSDLGDDLFTVEVIVQLVQRLGVDDQALIL